VSLKVDPPHEIPKLVPGLEKWFPGILRNVVFGKARVTVFYAPISITPINYSNAKLAVQSDGVDLLEVSMGLDEGYSTIRRVTGNSADDSNTGLIKAPRDGKPPADFIEFVRKGVSAAFGRFLIVGAADAKNASEEPRPE
jgi:hypothetical protein